MLHAVIDQIWARWRGRIGGGGVDVGISERPAAGGGCLPGIHTICLTIYYAPICVGDAWPFCNVFLPVFSIREILNQFLSV